MSLDGYEDLTTMIESVRPAIVRLTVTKPDTDPTTGTGVLFDAVDGTGYLVTNYHVIENAASVTVTVNDYTNYIGTVRGIDTVLDLAVVSICCDDFRFLPFSRRLDLPAGSEVINIGYALGLGGEATVTQGIVSAVRYNKVRDAHFVQADAPINPGNSGGPMLDPSFGIVLGINTFKYTGDGLGFAISGRDVLKVLSKLQHASPAPPTLYGPVSGSLNLDALPIHYSGLQLQDGVVEGAVLQQRGSQRRHYLVSSR